MRAVENLSKQERMVWAVKALVARHGLDGARWYIEDQCIRIYKMKNQPAQVATFEAWLVILDELEEAN